MARGNDMSNEWYYFKGENRIGPLSSQQLKAISLDGTLDRSDTVWKEGMEKAVPAEKLKGLFESSVAESNSQVPQVQNKTSTGIDWY